MVLPASIGIYPHEHRDRQRVRVNVDLAVDDETAATGGIVGPDELNRVVNYEKIVAVGARDNRIRPYAAGRNHGGAHRRGLPARYPGQDRPDSG